MSEPILDDPIVPAPSGWRLTGDTTDRLDASSSGTWLTTTRGSRHIWEISSDGSTDWTRLPGEGRASFEEDSEAQRLTRVQLWPEVGSKFFVWFDDPEEPFAIEQWRLSSVVRRIERMERDDE